MQTLLDAVRGRYPGHIVMMRSGDGYALYGGDAIKAGDILRRDIHLSRTRVDEDGDAVNELVIPSAEMAAVVAQLSVQSDVVLCEREDCQVSTSYYDAVARVYGVRDAVASAFGRADDSHVLENAVLDTDYHRETDTLVINVSRDGEAGVELDAAVSRLNDAYRAAVAYVGAPSRLDREGSQNLLPADARRYDALVRELGAAVLMLRQGLPGSVSGDDRDLVAYWQREMTEDADIVSRLEDDVNNAVEAVEAVVRGETVNYAAVRGSRHFSMGAENTYSVSQNPDAASRSVVVIRQEMSHSADVILPQGASREVRNEADGIRKNSIVLALLKDGIDRVTFYNAGGALALKEPNDYYGDKKVELCSLLGTTLLVKETYDLSEEIASTNRVRIEYADMIPAGDGNYALYVKPAGQEPVVVFPDPKDITRFFDVARHQRDRLDDLRMTMGRRYYNIVLQHPEFKADILMPRPVDVDMSRLSDVNIRMDRNTRNWLLFADIDNVHQKPVEIDGLQAQRFFLVDREKQEIFKLRLAADVFKEKLGYSEGRGDAQFRQSEEGCGAGPVPVSEKEGSKDGVVQEEVRGGLRL